MAEKSHKGLVLRDVTVKRGSKIFTQKRWVKASKDEPEPKKSKKVEVKDDFKGKESYKIGDSISFMGKDLKVEKVSESEKTVKLSDDRVYTFGAINKGKNINKKKTVKDLKIDKKKLEKSETLKFNEDGFIFKSKFNKPKVIINFNKNINAKSNKSEYALTPRSYDKKKRQKDENAAVTDMQKWLEDQQNHLEDELKKLYPNL